MLFGIYDTHVYINTHNRRVIYPMLLECLECLEFSFPIVKIRPPVEKRKILDILDDVIMGPFKVTLGLIFSPKSTTNILCSCMIWADDLLILSRTEEGLQMMLDNLYTFSENNGLSANIDKTKVMIFNKSGRHIHRSFNWGALKVETTREYKYLGFRVTPSGEINSGLKDLKDLKVKSIYETENETWPIF